VERPFGAFLHEMDFVTRTRLCAAATAVLMLALSGCATVPREVRVPALAPSQRGIVFSIDGAGGFGATSNALRRATEEACMPLAVDTFDWSHGYCRVLADQMDYCHTRAEGLRLAAEIRAFRGLAPGKEIYVVGHSAGCAVALVAADALPPNTVCRIILLAPSVANTYDLRPALRTAQEGIDVFYSAHDLFYLGLGTALLGTADRCWGHAAAGRTGFRFTPQTPEDGLLYAKLHQHPWEPCVAWSGNLGGHYGPYQAGYLRAFILPLLTRSTPLASAGCQAPVRKTLPGA
jgi:pimeloyl-ACP methyl ester carboxylesterase